MSWTFVILVLSITTHSIYYHRPYQPFSVMLWTTSFSATEAEFCKFSNPLIFFSTFINISSTAESKYKQHDQIFFSWIFYSLLVCLMVFNATFNNISAITWRQSHWWRKPEDQGKTTDLSQVTDKLYHKTDSEGRLRTKHYYKRDDFKFPIVNLPFIYSNIPAAPAYGVYIPQLIHYFRAPELVVPVRISMIEGGC